MTSYFSSLISPSQSTGGNFSTPSDSTHTHPADNTQGGYGGQEAKREGFEPGFASSTNDALSNVNVGGTREGYSQGGSQTASYPSTTSTTMADNRPSESSYDSAQTSRLPATTGGVLGSGIDDFSQGNREGGGYGGLDNNSSNSGSGFSSSNTGTGGTVLGGTSASGNKNTATGYDSSDLPSTGNPKADHYAGKATDKLNEKLENETGEDGFTNMTGDKKPMGGALTGRVKVNQDNDEPPVVETTKKRSERDSQGRELDSYGNPYTL